MSLNWTAAACIALGIGAQHSAASQACDETRVLVSVPEAVSAEALLRARGDPGGSAPVLILENVELGMNEGVTIRVLGPKPSNSGQPPVLGVAETIGERQDRLKPPLRHMTLAIPLNDKALALLVDRREITLTLQVEDGARRPPLKMQRVFLHTPAKP